MVLYLRLTKDGQIIASDGEIYNNGVEDLFLGTPHFAFSLRDNLNNVFGKDYLIERFKLKPGQNIKCELREWPEEN